MSWFIFILALGYFGYNISRFWVEREYMGSGLLRNALVILFGCFIIAIENFRIIFGARRDGIKML